MDDTDSRYQITRRGFLKGIGALGAVSAFGDLIWPGSAKSLFAQVATGGAGEEKWVPWACMQCGCGPDPGRARVVNGVLVKVEGNPVFRDQWRNPSLLCATPHAVPQKLYNPYRIKSPMKRTNPKKGMKENPGFVEISWDEALDILTKKLKKIRTKGVVDEHGIPRVALSVGVPSVMGFMGHGWWPFWVAWGKFDMGFGGGAGVKCTQTSHVLGEFWNRSFIDTPDYPHVNYVLSFGGNFSHNTRWSGSGNTRADADARARGMKLVMVAPSINPSGAVANEWIPIRVKSDAAFALGMLNVVLHEMDWKKVCDMDFLKKRSNSPYLIGPHGNYVRDPESKKPLVWDPSVNSQRPFDEARDFVLSGTFEVKGIEIGADGETFEVTTAVPSHQLLIKHIKQYTPEWAQEITDVPAETIRRIAKEFVEAATVGAEIEIGGVKLPHRPVTIALGRGTDNGWGAHELVWAKMTLLTLLGAIEVPGGALGCDSIIYERIPFSRDDDGFIITSLVPTSKDKWEWPPTHRDGSHTLTPLAGTHGLSFAAHHLSWKSFTDPLDKWPISLPDALILHHCNPVANGVDSHMVRRGLEMSPFTAVFAFTMNETNWYADLLMPENPDFESYQVLRSPRGIKANSVKSKGALLRQPVIKKLYNTMELTDIFTELAERLKLLPRYNGVFNAMNHLRGKSKLIPTKKYSAEEMAERVALSITGGKQGLAYLKEHGAFLEPVSELQCYQYLEVVEKKMRYELPYQGKIKIAGEELVRRVKEVGLTWWERQAAALAEPLPLWQGAPDIYREVYNAGSEHLWVIGTRPQVFPGMQNLEVPWNTEIAEDMLEGLKVLINPRTAKKRGVKDGDRVCLESAFGKQYGIARFSETVHPEVVSTLGWGHYMTPVSKDLGTPNPSELDTADLRLTCPDGSTSLHTLVKIYKA